MVEYFKPQAFVMENVPNILSIGDGIIKASIIDHCLGVPVIKDDKKDDKKGDKKEFTDIQRVLISFISENDKITISEMARKTALSESTISREIKRLRVDHKILNREGGRKNGHWVIIK